MLSVTTRRPGSASRSHGRCLRIRVSASVDRSTQRTISSPAGDSVTSTCLSSPLRVGTSYGVSAARVTNAARTGSAATIPAEWSAQSRRSTAPRRGSHRPRVGWSTVPPTTILALVRNPSGALAHRRQPLRLRAAAEGGADQLPGRRLLARELLVVRTLQPGARPTLEPVVVPALQGGPDRPGRRGGRSGHVINRRSQASAVALRAAIAQPKASGSTMLPSDRNSGSTIRPGTAHATSTAARRGR